MDFEPKGKSKDFFQTGLGRTEGDAGFSGYGIQKIWMGLVWG
jgi:hypothetical protein